LLVGLSEAAAIAAGVQDMPRGAQREVLRWTAPVVLMQREGWLFVGVPVVMEDASMKKIAVVLALAVLGFVTLSSRADGAATGCDDNPPACGAKAKAVCVCDQGVGCWWTCKVAATPI
jgi:hypothetical protein